MNLKEKIDKTRIPKHVAIIMDGNGRWAMQRQFERAQGHKMGAKAVREVVEMSVELGIEYLTLYAFSIENWQRPKEEVDALMQLLVESLLNETPLLQQHGIKLKTIGNIAELNKEVLTKLEDVVALTSKNSRMTLVLALNYSGRWEIVENIKKIATHIQQGKINTDQITEKTVSDHMQTSFMPDPELIIRTSGEERLSNFLLWQAAYSEFYFTPVLWPDFGKKDFCEAIFTFQNRERRFGKTSEQLTI